MNQLIKKSEEARAALQAGTDMDDLSYHLMVLEAGCQCLDQTLRPVGASLDAKTVELYRAHFYAQGWWTWFELFWRSFEIRLWAEWSGPESLVIHQTAVWRRTELIKEATTLFYTSHYQHAFDHFLKMLEERGTLAMPMPSTQPATTPQHAH